MMRKLHKSRFIALAMIASVFLLFIPFSTYAEEDNTDEIENIESSNDVEDSEEQQKEQEDEILQKYEDLDNILVLDKGIWYQDILRGAGKGIMMLLAKVVDYLENGVDTLLGQNHFYEETGVKSLMNMLAPYAFGLFFLSLIVLGFQFMWNKIDNRAELAMNIVLAISVIILIPKMFGILDDVLQWGLDGISGRNTLSEEIITKNVADLKLYVENDLEYAGASDNNYSGGGGTLPRPPHKEDTDIGTTDFQHANSLKGTDVAVTEKLDIQSDEGWFPWTTEDWVSDLEKNHNLSYEFLMNKAVPTSDGRTLKTKELAKNAVPGTKIGQESYFRYKLNWGTIFATLAIVGFVLAITVVKVARVMYELAFHGIAGMFVAATDITGGQRVKKIITEIVSSFAVLFVMVLILKLFTYYTNWALDIKSEIGWLPYILVMIAGAWAVIDAPDIVTRILGIDAGLRSGWQAMASTYAGGKIAGGLAKGAGKGAGNLAKGASSTKGFVDGLRGKNPATENKGKSNNNGLGSGSTQPTGTGGTGQGKGGKSDIDNKTDESSNIPDSNSQGGSGSSDSRQDNNGSQSSNSTNKPIDNKSNEGEKIPNRKGNSEAGSNHHESIPNNTGGNQIPDGQEYGTGSNTAKPIENTNDTRNPYQDNAGGIFSGTRGSRSRADAKARSYNTGLRIRNKLRNKFKRIDDDIDDEG